MSLLWGLVSGPECFVGLAPFLGLASGPVSLIFFYPYQLPPSPGVRRTWARAVMCLASGAISTCLLGVGLVRA